MWCIFKKHDSEQSLVEEKQSKIFFSQSWTSADLPQLSSNIQRGSKANIALTKPNLHFLLRPIKDYFYGKVKSVYHAGSSQYGVDWLCVVAKTNLKPPCQSAPPTCVQVTKRKFKLQNTVATRQASALALVPGSWPPEHHLYWDEVQNWGKTARLSLVENSGSWVRFFSVSRTLGRAGLTSLDPQMEWAACRDFRVFPQLWKSSDRRDPGGWEPRTRPRSDRELLRVSVCQSIWIFTSRAGDSFKYTTELSASCNVSTPRITLPTIRLHLDFAMTPATCYKGELGVVSQLSLPILCRNCKIVELKYCQC